MARVRLRVRLNPSDSSTDDDSNFDQRGKFAEGNKKGKGNPYASKIQHYRKILLGFYTDEKYLDILDAMHTAAVGGDVAACRIILERLNGRVPADPYQMDFQMAQADPDERFL